MSFELAKYLDEEIEKYDRDPPVEDWEEGYLQALRVIREMLDK